jgi:hypothetical protein
MSVNQLPTDQPDVWTEERDECKACNFLDWKTILGTDQLHDADCRCLGDRWVICLHGKEVPCPGCADCEHLDYEPPSGRGG